MIRLCVGISSLSPVMQSLFENLGVNAEEIDFSSLISNRYSSLIINSELDKDEWRKVFHFLKNDSGGVILPKKFASSFSKERTLSNVDLELPQVYSDRVEAFYLGGGLIFGLDFDPELEWKNSNYKRKRFHFESDFHPDEIVSSVDRVSFSKTIELLLKELSYSRKLPFVSKWHSPTKKALFAFRVDTDFGHKSSLQNLYELADRHQIPMTWFLHVQAHEEWLNYFHDFKNQEIALHGYEHGTSTSYEHIINNIERGKQLMVDAGLNPAGFCIPYSIWNDTLGDILTKFDFKYSSEFTIGYDTTPFYPIYKDNQHPTLQIPIHPICTGSLNRKKASIEMMEKYFHKVLDERSEWMQNVIFYHHPLQPGLDIWKSVFEKVNELNLAKRTFSQIANFWTERKNTIVNLHFDVDNSTLMCDSSNSNLFLNVSLSSKEFYLIESSNVNRPLNSFDPIQTPKIQSLSKEKIKELTDNRLQLWKTSILDWKNRIKL